MKRVIVGLIGFFLMFFGFYTLIFLPVPDVWFDIFAYSLIIGVDVFIGALLFIASLVGSNWDTTDPHPEHTMD